MLDLFGEKPRRPRRVLMHVIDAGDNCGDEHFDVVCKFGCSTCGTETDWLQVENVTAARTPWFPPGVQPKRAGFYESYYHSPSYATLRYFDGKRWFLSVTANGRHVFRAGGDVLYWRGLTTKSGGD